LPQKRTSSLLKNVEIGVFCVLAGHVGSGRWGWI
jgi:hypothetical protein